MIRHILIAGLNDLRKEMDSRSHFSPFGLGPQETLAYRKRFRGMISVASKIPLKDRSVLSLLYTPGVAAPCLAIAKEPLTSFDYTLRGNTIALVSDGSSAFGFGNIGPMAALPMLEDACILFKTFGGVNAFPICLNTQDIEQSIATGIAIWPTFGGFCLSSIASPRCFTVTDHLARAVNIPVLNADEHATATTILGALSNALKLVGKAKEAVRVVIGGSGPGGIGTARLLLQAGFQHILVCDRLGILYRYRTRNMNWAKLDIARRTNPADVSGTLSDALRDADVYIGLSSWSTITPEMVSSMAAQSILFTLALPDPGITPEAAVAAEAAQRSGVGRGERDPAEIEMEVWATIYEGHRPVPPPSHQYANLQEQALELHKRYQGVLEIQPKISIRDSLTLSSLYLHPGLPEATRQIISRPDAVFDYTGKSNRVAVITDGSAVLGLGNIGPRAGLPVMEGKAILF